MILLVGASASGKTEVAKRLASLHHIVKAITHTTRDMRINEKNGVDYYFVSKDEFLLLKEKGSFVETTEYNGNFYGCSKKEIRDDKCVIVDPNGLKSFLALNDSRIVTFYLRAKEETRMMRMRGRGDKEENILSRIEGDRIDFAPEMIAKTDFVIDTDEATLDELVEEVLSKYKSTLEKRK